MTLERDGDGRFLLRVPPGDPDADVVGAVLALRDGDDSLLDALPLAGLLDCNALSELDMRDALGAPTAVAVTVEPPGLRHGSGAAALARQHFHQPPPLLSVLDPLLADAMEIRGDAAWVRLRLRNDGGALWIDHAQLAPPRVTRERTVMFAGGRQSAAATQAAQFVPARATVTVEARATQTHHAEWLQLNGFHPAALELGGRNGAIDSVPCRVGRVSPPDLTLEFARPLKGMAGRRSRIGMALRNAGSTTLRIKALRARPTRHAEWMELPVPRGWADPLPPGPTAMAGELRIWLTDTGVATGVALSPGPLTLEVEVVASAEGTPVRRSFSANVTVVAEEPFRGRICVDVGTTETAASAGDYGVEVRRELKLVPAVIELRTIGLASAASASSTGAPFLATALVLDRAGCWHVGDDADAVLAAGDALCFDDFKWVSRDEQDYPLASREAILEAWHRTGAVRAEDVDPRLLQRVFLSQVRLLIEEHPVVCAKIGPRTELRATRPVHFSDSSVRALTAAFEAAGFPEPKSSVRASGGTAGLRRDFVRESWPPVLFVIEKSNSVFRGLPGASADRVDAEPYTLSARFAGSGEPVHVLIYDVGGGSADLSLIRVDSVEFGKEIVEVASDISRDFAGRPFARMIADVLREEIQRDTRQTPQEDHRFSAWIRAFQYDDGLLYPILPQLVREFERDAPTRAAVEQRLRQAFGEAELAVKTRIPPAVGLAKGGEYPLDLTAIGVIAAALVCRMYAEHRSAIRAKTEEMLAREPGGPVAHPVVILSGRGAAFPLAEALLRSRWDDLSEPAVQILAPPDSKSITSWGGLRLSDLAESKSGIHFRSAPPRYAVRVTAEHSVEMLVPDLAGPTCAYLKADRLPAEVWEDPLEIYTGPSAWEDHDYVPGEPRLIEGVDWREQWLVVRDDGEGGVVASVVRATSAEGALGLPAQGGGE
ncbi:Hsp70 family protein [Sphingomonas hengshuiensis]|uniref:Uncharacterized protein n=1 Tax=Sphingomonas hengshuiensis TaxID=1609977 RepID=A0A7U4JA18_9SPHN|nr:hypothetical protein [Sphingomonas hengshuiensis]AJP72993.1 hypothetical protein TS85_16120 [Sphingomonas hengshuiensis]